MGERKAVGPRMFLRLQSIPYLALAASALLAGCLGGSDGVENPKFNLELHGEDGAALSGRVSLYGGNQDPAENAAPLLAKDFAAGSAEFSPEEIDAALDKAMAAQGKDTSGIKDTTLHFNVVAASGDKEAFLGGFAYRRTGKTVGFGRGASGKYSFGRVYKQRFGVPKAVPFQGRIAGGGALLGIDYVFIPGSPYHSAVAKDSTFKVAKMGQGSYNIYGVDKDSALFFKSNDTLSTADTAYSAKDWGTVIFIPDH